MRSCLPYSGACPILRNLYSSRFVARILLEIYKDRTEICPGRKNPPSIPTLALVYLVSRLRGSKVIIDWHNLGYSILALKLGQSHVFVRIAKMCVYCRPSQCTWTVLNGVSTGLKRTLADLRMRISS